MKRKGHFLSLCVLSRTWLFATPWTVCSPPGSYAGIHQQEYWTWLRANTLGKLLRVMIWNQITNTHIIIKASTLVGNGSLILSSCNMFKQYMSTISYFHIINPSSLIVKPGAVSLLGNTRSRTFIAIMPNKWSETTKGLWVNCILWLKHTED